jgi:hypothetical protein
LGIILPARAPRLRLETGLTGSLPHLREYSDQLHAFGRMRLAGCKVQLKITEEKGEMLAGQLLIGAQGCEAGATPPPKGNRDAESPRNSEETTIPVNSMLN